MAYLVMAPATFNYYLKQLKQVDNQQQIKDKIKNIYIILIKVDIVITALPLP